MIISVRNVSKKFKDNIVLENVNMTLESGHIYGFYGRNGSGKSVLLKIISGFYMPSEGEVLYDGVNYNQKQMFPHSLRALIEKPSFFPDLTGYQNLKLLADIQKKINDEDILKALRVVNLEKDKDKKYSKYSLGMKQKLGICQAIMEDVDIIVLDEPFNGIEVSTVKKLITYLKEERNKDKIIIISTHIKEDLDSLTKEVFYFEDGQVFQKII